MEFKLLKKVNFTIEEYLNLPCFIQFIKSFLMRFLLFPETERA